MTVILNGIGVSRGIAIGRAQVLHHGPLDITETAVPNNQITSESKRLREGLKQTAKYLKTIRASVEKKFPPDVASFIDSHLLMLKDATLNDDVVKIIKDQQCNAEWALEIQKERLLAVFDQMNDEYLKTRRDDVEQVVHLVQRFLLKHKENPSLEPQKNLRGNIVIADDLTPADAILLQHQNIAGFVTEFGGPTSHTIILARGIGIPAVVSAHGIRSMIHENEEIIVNGDSGMIIAGANRALIHTYRDLQKEEKKRQSKLRLLRDKKTVTQDGVPVALLANVELAEEVRMLRKSGANGVGLYRTEYLYLGRAEAAGEAEQFQAYRRLLKAADQHPVTIRTLDIGGEKDFDPVQQSTSPNPALGLRAIRRSLKEPEVFLQQLRAILRASTYGNVRIMFPMLTNLAEVKQLKALVDTAKHQLRERKYKYADNIPVGGMIEVPAAALLAGEFAKHLDFLSIGTNDLIQYTLAIDRIDDEVSYLYDPLHPSVLKLIKTVISAGKKHNIPVAMCGEMAGDPRYVKLLLGMGLREFSSHISTLLEVKKTILESDVEKLEHRCRRILQVHSDRIPKLVANL